MQRPNLSNYNSKLKTTINYLRLYSKNYATYALPRTLVGNPHTNFLLNKLARQNLMTGKILPSTRLCEQSERIELLNLLDINRMGETFYA